MPGGELSIVAGNRTRTWTMDGKEYTASTLRLRQWAHLEEWVRNDIMKRAKETANGLNDRGLAKEIMAEAKEEARAISMTNPGFLDKLQSFEGLQELIWLSLNRHHPEISLTKAGDMVDISEAFNYMGDFMYLNEAVIKTGPEVGNGQAAAPESTQ